MRLKTKNVISRAKVSALLFIACGISAQASTLGELEVKQTAEKDTVYVVQKEHPSTYKIERELSDFLDGASKFFTNGSPYVTIFADFSNTTFNGSNHNSFNTTRAYLGYAHNINKNFAAKLTVEFGDPQTGDFRRTAILKHAFAQYSNETIDFFRLGISATLAYDFQEEFWGYRYVAPVAQEEYDLNPSADLGASMMVNLTEHLAVDGSIMNGEGFTDVDVDSVFRYSLGFIYEPKENLYVRGYWDFTKGGFGNDANEITYNIFAGYKGEKFRIGGEYVAQHNHRSIADEDVWLLSVYSSYRTSEKVSFFGRYDYGHNSANTPETQMEEGSSFILGGEFKPIKGIAISPNYTFKDNRFEGDTDRHLARLSLLIDF